MMSPEEFDPITMSPQKVEHSLANAFASAVLSTILVMLVEEFPQSAVAAYQHLNSFTNSKERTGTTLDQNGPKGHKEKPQHGR